MAAKGQGTSFSPSKPGRYQVRLYRPNTTWGIQYLYKVVDTEMPTGKSTYITIALGLLDQKQAQDIADRENAKDKTMKATSKKSKLREQLRLPFLKENAAEDEERVVTQEDRDEYYIFCRKCKKDSTLRGSAIGDAKCPECGSTDIKWDQSESVNEATDTFAVMAIDPQTDAYRPRWDREGPSPKVVWQMWDLAKGEVVIAAKMAREKHPKATISVENKAGKIVRVWKPGVPITEAVGNPNNEPFIAAYVSKDHSVSCVITRAGRTMSSPVRMTFKNDKTKTVLGDILYVGKKAAEKDWMQVHTGGIKYAQRLLATNAAFPTNEEAAGAPKTPTEVDRLKTAQETEKIQLQQRQANQLMAAKLRDVQQKSREQMNKATAPKSAAKSA